MTGRRLRIAHLPGDLGMRAASLAAAERRLGLDSRIYVRRAGAHVSGVARPIASSNPFLYAWRILRGLIEILGADVIMANQGSCWLDFNRYGIELIELPLYRLLGKRLIVTFQGCELRPCEDCPVRREIGAGETCVNLDPRHSYATFDAWKARRLAKWRRYADAMLMISPDLSADPDIHFTGHAKLVEDRERAHRDPAAPIVIVHGPKPHLTDTPAIEAALSALARERPGQIEFVSAEGLGWKACVDLLRRADILVDRLRLAWYGGISVEAAMVGTLPVTLIDRSLLARIPEAMREDLPVLAIGRKEDLLPTLRALLDDRQRLRREAERCKRSAWRWHDAHRIARTMVGRYYGGLGASAEAGTSGVDGVSTTSA